MDVLNQHQAEARYRDVRHPYFPQVPFIFHTHFLVFQEYVPLLSFCGVVKPIRPLSKEFPLIRTQMWIPKHVIRKHRYYCIPSHGPQEKEDIGMYTKEGEATVPKRNIAKKLE